MQVRREVAGEGRPGTHSLALGKSSPGAGKTGAPFAGRFVTISFQEFTPEREIED